MSQSQRLNLKKILMKILCNDLKKLYFNNKKPNKIKKSNNKDNKIKSI